MHVGAVAGDDQVDLVDVEQLGVDRRDACRVGLIVVVNELHLPAEQATLGVDSSRQISMAIRADLPPAPSGPVRDMEKPILIGVCWATAGAAKRAATAEAPSAAPASLRVIKSVMRAFLPVET